MTYPSDLDKVGVWRMDRRQIGLHRLAGFLVDGDSAGPNFAWSKAELPFQNLDKSDRSLGRCVLVDHQMGIAWQIGSLVGLG